MKNNIIRNCRYSNVHIYAFFIILFSGCPGYALSEGNWLGLSFRLVISEGGVFPVSIASVKQGSLAEHAGFQQGDIIYRVNNLPVSPSNFFSVLESFPVGSKTTFQVIRNNKLWPVEVILPDRTKGTPETVHATFKESKNVPGVDPVIITKQSEPVYPEEARIKNIEGLVHLELKINEKGNLKNLKVVKSPHKLLSEAAVTAVKQWKFTPAKKHGVPIATILQITINFRLNK
ncbi:MAG: hypothetical protein A2161_02890 [Candidatus Schekmanbacteria bacterium RBG_13_48_7]|uniref:Uncharacterized protein n=1 Tax=Candidatus Schekmanbacteria bacterium RBG_13_48_7 TaxID=1817878 RepID=A0A1F7RS43_9BACT|nr:MAG: hypothetical protein A2161_02890 [Candidatus Schekmanbacteria bacterium RBG_13_48_7]